MTVSPRWLILVLSSQKVKALSRVHTPACQRTLSVSQLILLLVPFIEFIAMTTSGGGGALADGPVLGWTCWATGEETQSLCLLLLSHSQGLSPGYQRLSRHFLVSSWSLLTAAEFQPLSSVGRRSPHLALAESLEHILPGLCSW